MRNVGGMKVILMKCSSADKDLTAELSDEQFVHFRAIAHDVLV